MKKSTVGWRWVAIAILSIFILGCARTRITSQVNPEHVRRDFACLLVHGNFKNLEYRKLAENKLCSELSRLTNCQCLKSSEVFFPAKEYSKEDIKDRLTELRIDAVLTLQPMDSGTTSTYVPQWSYTTGCAQVFGNIITGSSTTWTHGGYDVSKPWASYEAVLWSTSDDEVVWYATVSSKGNAFASWDNLIKSASAKTVSKLVADSVSW